MPFFWKITFQYHQQGRKFEASLRESGLIESAGGETFRTPMAWMRAVTGSWNTVKQSQAYKMVRAYMLHGYRVPKRARGLGIFSNYDNFEPWAATSIYKQGIAVSTIVYSPATFPLPLLLQKFVTVAGGGGGGRRV